MPASHALATRPPLRRSGNRHIAAAILVVLYALLLIAGLGLAIVAPRPPSAQRQPSVAPALSVGQPGHQLGSSVSMHHLDTDGGLK